MKNLLKVLSLIIVIVGLNFQSCIDEDDDGGSSNVIETYFTVDNAEFLNTDFPEETASATAPDIAMVTGNANVLNGGSSPIAIATDSENISHVLVGINGQQGYYKIPATAAKDGGVYHIVLMLGTSIPQEAFTLVIALLNTSGEVSQMQDLGIVTIEAGTGKLQVNCSWDQLNDVDLHLIEPNGEKIYFGNSTSANGGELDVDSNPACTIDGINNENITYVDGTTVEAGIYEVQLNLYENCNITENTNYTVTARYHGEIIATASGTNPNSGYFTPDGSDNVTIMTFNIASATKNTVKMLHFTYPNRIKKVLSPQKM